ncbi:ABC transporter substrate-binding protein [Streptomyces sp. HNM0575]|uniref:ABC transporter substrate-binding protein n=1 Tax=Streptomyces sp. HNM0575 TaxID=2716338 RepID=UPI00145F8A44|nr:ABC transporter substrate-binding protein [Streptomyces sp. HNM0575]NLU72703.1 ABC transporter substrate-binding protein [Streptomyces sp. HNM0575]
MRINKIAVIAVTMAMAMPLAACADKKSGGSGGGSGTVTIGLSNQENQSYLPLILADRLGLFKKQGLNVKLNNLKETSQVSNALLANQVQAAVGFYDHSLDLQAKGKQTQAVIQLLQAPGMVAMARPKAGIESPKDYKGKTLGVTGIGSSTSYLGQYLAVHNGVPAKEVHLAAVAAGPTFVGAFEHKRVDAGVTTEPTVSTLLKKKLGKITADMRTAAGTKAALGGPYPGTAMMVESSWGKKHEATVQKMVNALYESLQWIESHSAKEITAKVPPDFYKGPGKEQYTQALANEMGMYNPSGQMPTDGPQSVHRVLSTIDKELKGHKIDLSKTYTDKYVQKAAKSVKSSSK